MEEAAQAAAARVYALASGADPALAPKARRERADPLAARALAAQAQARASRWSGDNARLAHALADPDFDALRDRDEFRELVDALAFPAEPVRSLNELSSRGSTT